MLDAWLNNLAKTGRTKKQAVSIVVDSLLVVLALWAAYSLRHGMPFSDLRSTWHLFVLLPLITVLIFVLLGIYRWVVRSTNETLFLQIVKGCILASLALIVMTFLIPPDRTNPRSLFIIFGMVLLLGTCSTRYLWRSFFEHAHQGEPVAIYGAGDAGRRLQFSLSQGVEFRPILFLDDNPTVSGSTVSGIPVVQGDSNDIKSILNSLEIERVIMAMPTINASEYQEKVERIRSTGAFVQTIPTYAELMANEEKVGEVRDISIADILGRTEVPPDPALLGGCVRDKAVMVTGGGGSIGSELCRQILVQHPKQLIVLDHSEENLYKITEELTQQITGNFDSEVEFLPILCSITDKDRVNQVFDRYAIDTVFHAAAYKHVPIIESHPEQGVKVNILGTLNVLDAAIEAKVQNFTLISTDKAVRPTNAMGATKRIAELILQAKANIPGIETCISMVRFGNVLGSSGSVVPKFKSQIEANGPITITDPDITRYFMTIPEAAQLVMQASAIAKGGEVFVLDMGKPVRIEDLAIAMVRMSGKALKRDTGRASDIDIVVEGLRPGEKMYEELFLTETSKSTQVAKVFSANEHWISWSELQKWLVAIEDNASPMLQKQLKKLLLDLAFINADKPDVQPIEKVGKRAGARGKRKFELVN